MGVTSDAGKAAAEQALPDAAKIGSGWPLALIRHTVTNATRSGQDVWVALTDLGERIGVAQLRELGTLVQLVANDGVRGGLLAGAGDAGSGLRVHSPRTRLGGHDDMNTLDHNAIVGRASEVRNFYLANGFSGHGLQQSPAVGRGLAELIVHGRYLSLDLGDLGYERVLEGRPLLERNVI